MHEENSLNDNRLVEQKVVIATEGLLLLYMMDVTFQSRESQKSQGLNSPLRVNYYKLKSTRKADKVMATAL